MHGDHPDFFSFQSLLVERETLLIGLVLISRAAREQNVVAAGSQRWADCCLHAEERDEKAQLSLSLSLLSGFSGWEEVATCGMKRTDP